MSSEANTQLDNLLGQLINKPEQVQFNDVMAFIAAHYQYQPVAFSNGEVINKLGENEGSCKIFYFAMLNDLSVQQTLHCFGDYYRNDVLKNPDGDDHANIRNFINTGWPGVSFEGVALR